jgi:hypothetical protein
MATRNIVPNENNEGSLGTDPKRWASVHATELKQAGNDVLDVSDLASDAEAEAGTDNTKWMTPLRTAQAMAKARPSFLLTNEATGKVFRYTSDTNGDLLINEVV